MLKMLYLDWIYVGINLPQWNNLILDQNLKHFNFKFKGTENILKKNYEKGKVYFNILKII